MKNLFKGLLSLYILSVSHVCEVSAKNIYVSPEGRDTNKGTIESPFKSLQRAATEIKAGDICYLRGGDYNIPAKLMNLHGTKQAPITIKAYEDERVRLNGTYEIEGEWRREGDRYTMKLKNDIWQLFADGEMMTAARWPNANMSDSLFWNQKVTYRKMATESTFGRAVDARSESGEGYGSDVNMTKKSSDILPDELNTQTLAESGIDATGAIAVMNIGSWRTFAQFVENHKAGENAFTYSTEFPNDKAFIKKFCGNEKWWNTKNSKNGQAHYFLEGESCLDAEREWWYNPESRVLSFIPPKGKSLDDMEIRGKNITYILTILNSSYITFDNIDFWGTTFTSNNSNNITIKNAHFKYPAYSKRVLGDLGEVQPTTFRNKRDDSIATNNRIINCIFEQFDGTTIKYIGGRGNSIDNVLISQADYSCLGQGFTLDAGSTDGDFFVRRLTMTNTGASEGLKVSNGSIVEYSRLGPNVGVFQHDGSPLQCAYFESMNYHHNWSHDHQKAPYRFDDGGGAPVPPSINGAMHHNVAWNCREFQVKGDKQSVYNNTTYNSIGINMMVWEPMNGIHKESILANNLADNFTTRIWLKVQPEFPGVMGVNQWGGVDEQLRDPRNGDFRPRKGAAIVDKGRFNEIERHPRYNSELFTVVGAAPDLGAYEYGDDSYWIAGFQHSAASTPIPFDGGVDVKRDADLMWLFGYKTDVATIYLGESESKLTKVATQSNNIYTPKGLESGKRYYWRVDCSGVDGVVKRGDVWSFVVE